MLGAIIEKNIESLQKYGVQIKTEDDKSIYRYGLQILYSYIINVTVILTISALFGKFYETAIMIFVFAVFQVFNGGYHAKTKIKCSALMVLGSIAGNVLASIIQGNEIAMIASAVVLSIVVVAVGPVANARHPVSKTTFNRSKRIARIAVLASLFSVALMLGIGKNIEAAAIVSTLYLYIISLSTAKTI
jgi:accessory gene regulator B